MTDARRMDLFRTIYIYNIIYTRYSREQRWRRRERQTSPGTIVDVPGGRGIWDHLGCQTVQMTRETKKKKSFHRRKLIISYIML